MSRHVYYKIHLTLESSLSIGSGSQESSDSDIVRDGRKLPHIPGTTLAGVYRSLLKEADREKYFGFVRKEGDDKERDDKEGDDKAADGDPEAMQSPLLVYDGVLISKNPVITKRDCVKLDAYKVSEAKAKFDFEVLEPGAIFQTFIEVDRNHNSEEMEKMIDTVLYALDRGEIMLGQKTTRGYGRFSVSYCKKSFDLDQDLKSWLDFRMFDDNQWTEPWKTPVLKTESADVLQADVRQADVPQADAPQAGVRQADVPQVDILQYETVKIPLRQDGALSIRSYVTDAAPKDQSVPDYKQLTLQDGGPIIPGTSWAGAFRHRMEVLLEQVKPEMVQQREDPCKEPCGEPPDKSPDIPQWTELSRLFGMVSEAGKGEKSKILFGESRMAGGFFKEITRNSIDRFSAATREGALYTERTYYNGILTLEMKIKKEIFRQEEYRLIRQLLAVCIVDLHYGLLAVGGLTAVGRGLFRVTGAIEMGSRKITIAELERGLWYE